MESNLFFAKYKDPRWQRVRLKVLDRDGWACAMCGATDKPLVVHHGYYEGSRDPWDYSTDTLHTVCKDCHFSADDLRSDLHFELAKVPLRLHRLLLQLFYALRTNTTTQQAVPLLKSILERTSNLEATP